MKKKFFKLITRLRCTHQEEIRDAAGKILMIENLCRVSPCFPVSEWSVPERHPHPMFAEKVRVCSRRTAYISHCLKCGRITIVYGLDVKEADA